MEAVLGEGGMGTVFAAHDLNLDRPVAIKALHARPDRDDSRARFLREAKVTARLASEHTVRVYELGTDAHGIPYIVMERVSGRAFDALVADRGPVPVDQAVAYAVQICSALSEAHAFGIVHRDVKPGNVLLDESGPLARVKVVDFGVAKDRRHEADRSGLTAISTLLGTPEYMAPEQLYAAREADARADIWGLGATLYFMLVGESPFSASTLEELLGKIQHGPTPSVRARRAEVSRAVEVIVARCLHRDPAGRFRSMDQLSAALRTAAREAPKLPSLVDEGAALDDATRAMDGSTEVMIEGVRPAVREVTRSLPSAHSPVARPSGMHAPASVETSAAASEVLPARPAPAPAPMRPPEATRLPGAPAWPWIVGALAAGTALGGIVSRLLGH